MPPNKKYTKDEIVNIAYKIVESEGFENLNARRIAKELNASVQPIFHNFTSMEELKNTVYEKIYETYQNYMERVTEKHAYKQSGLSYIEFAKDHPVLFKILFMKETNNSPENFIINDSEGEDIIKKGQQLTGLSYEDQKKFHVKVFIFTHGIACLLATKTVKLEENEIEELLTNTVLELLKGYKEERL
jgi:AcrR family transcriptional regulator